MISRRKFLGALAAAGFGATARPRVSFGQAGAAGAARRPNFLVIIADDLYWRDLGCMGNPDVKTPNIDRLASESMTLRGMFTPAPTCSPTRHALYTGLFPVRSGAYPNHTMVDPPTRSIFSYLKEMGYRVALQNKSHVSPLSSFPYERLGNPDDPAILAEFINRDPAQPWLACFCSNDPHGPWTRGPKDLYDPEKIAVPPFLHDNAETRKDLAAYYAEITQLDTQVGACLKTLEESGQAGDTLALFLSEQGSSFPYGGKWSLYDNGIRIAAFARWPGRIRPGSSSEALMQYVDLAPTIIEAAGGDPAAIDTGCPDANGDRGFDGRSFLDVLLGESDRLREYVFAQHTTVGINGYKEPYPIRAVRDARYKLIRNLAPENTFTIGGIHKGPLIESWKRDAASDPALAARVEWLFRRPAEELYDLESDPYEMTNLADDPSLAGVKARLGQALDAWMAQQGDKGMETEMNAPKRQPKNVKELEAEDGGETAAAPAAARRRANRNRAAQAGANKGD
ncbi:MAG: Choline-sulfatase [candidate division BRC1 bacterium ADurb.BinA364]|nr:MAG: Choline-sulfatase [candidate division BRC1 bacterium ADurb.BinA364]